MRDRFGSRPVQKQGSVRFCILLNRFSLWDWGKGTTSKYPNPKFTHFQPILFASSPLLAVWFPFSASLSFRLLLLPLFINSIQYHSGIWSFLLLLSLFSLFLSPIRCVFPATNNQQPTINNQQPETSSMSLLFPS